MKAAACVWMLLLSGEAFADDIADQAKRHYDDATAAYNLGDFARAAEEYRESYKLIHDPVLLYDAAQACRLGNDPQQAIFLYRSYLRSVPNAPNRKQVEERIATLDRQLATRQPAPLPVEHGIEPKASAPPPPVNAPAPSTPIQAAKSTVLTAPIPSRPANPIYKKWWLWTIVGLVAAGAAAGVAVGVTQTTNSAPSTGLGVMSIF